MTIRNMQIPLVVLLSICLVIAASSSSSSACSNKSSEGDCLGAGECAWTEIPGQSACQLQTVCAGKSQSDCQSSTSSLACSWKAETPGTCVQQPTLCTVSPDGQSCTDNYTCMYTPQTISKCQPVGTSFGCSEQPSQASCANSPQCTWQDSYCVSAQACESQSLQYCDQNNCDYKVTACTETPYVYPCPANLAASDCQIRGCTYNYASYTCSAPVCSVVNNQCNSTRCQPSAGTCSTSQSKCNNQDYNGCARNYCNWVTTSPRCADNSTYCDGFQTCPSQISPYCETVLSMPAKCTAQTFNHCSGLAESDCTSDSMKSICEFIQLLNGKCVNNVANCSVFTEMNFCNAQTSQCQWVSEKQCVEQSPSLLSS